MKPINMKKFSFISFLIASSLVSQNSYSQIDLNLGLVAYYPFNGNANDASGYGNNPIFNSAVLTTDMDGNANSAYSFDGNQYIRIPHSNSLLFNKEMTLSVQFYATKRGLQTFFGKIAYGGSTGTQFQMAMDYTPFPGAYCGINNAIGTCAGLPIPNSLVNSGGALDLLRWYCFTSTFKDGIQYLYINGTLIQTSIAGFSDLLNCTNSSIQIGTWWSADPQWFQGKLDEIRIYNRALNQEEITAISPCIPFPCTNWLKTDGNILRSGVEIGDLDINGNQLTVECQFNASSFPISSAAGGILVSKHGDPTDINYLLSPESAEISTNNGNFSAQSTCPIELNKTYHAAMVYDGQKLKLYRNGFLLSEITCTGNLIQNNLKTMIGASASALNLLKTEFSGVVNEVRIWNVARTKEDIVKFMNQTLLNPSTQPGLLANYTFDNLLNKQGNAAFNGSLIGFAAINATNPQCTFTADSCKVNIVSPSFTIADTICVDSPLVITNTSTGATTYNWSFCASDLNTTPTGVNLGNPSSQLATPVFMDYALNDDGNYYGLVMNYGTGNIIKLNYGNSLLNAPTATNLGNFGGVLRPSGEGIQIVKAGTKWIAIIVGGGNVAGSSSSVAKLDFGNSLGNTPTAINWGNIDNALFFPHDLVIAKEGTQYYGLTININNNTITRLNFGADFSTTPTATNLGNIGNLNYPCGMSYINSAGNNYVFITNRDANSISRLDFGLSLSNTPTGIRLPIANGKLQRPRDISILETCQGITGLVVNELTDDIVKLDFGSNILSNPLASELGNPGNLNFPHSISRFFLQENDIYAFITNADNNTLSRLVYAGCALPGSTLQNPPPVIYDAPGVYNINLLVDIGLPTQASYCKQVVVEDCSPCTLTITATKDTTICKGSSVELNASGAVTYLWNASPYLSNTNTANPIANPPVTTNFIVTGTDALGCIDTDTVLVTVYNLPVVIANNDTSICGSGVVQLSVSPPTGGTYSWTPPTGLNNATIANPIATLSATTEYFVSFTDANGCKNLDSVTITVNAIPTISTRSDTSICNGASLILTTIGTGSTYTWTPATGLNNSNIISPTANPSTTTNYIVTTTTAAGCINKDTVSIIVLEVPQVNASGDTTICGSSSVQLNANASGAISYSWTPTTGLNNPNISNPLANPDATTNYLVTATGANGCKNTDSVLVQIFPKPQFSVAPPFALLCEGTSLTLTAYGGDSYSWYGDTSFTSINSAVTTVTPLESVIYSVIIEEEKCMLTDTLFVDVSVLSSPIASASKSNDITCNVLETQLSSTGGLRFNWTPASTLSNSNISNPIANPTETTLYTVKVTSETGCTDTDTVTVLASGGDTEKTFFVPTAFSPNGDGLNDCFSLQKWGNVSITEFAIYNKWGNKVFYSNDINQCWDGYYLKTAQPPGVYVYYILAESPICGKFNRKGTIVLIR